ncbi:MAG TPA: L,D-transpeptidase [Gaiellaceae bacterium]|jgi:lipoprotein-anchoring transpeptidase ErfK/SrfK
MSLRRLRSAILVVTATAVLAPAAAWADGPWLSTPSGGINWTAGTITVAADYPAGTKTVFFSTSGEPLATVAVANPALAGKVSSGVPFHLTAPTWFGADALDAQGRSLGKATLKFTPAMYRPSTPGPALRSGTIVAPSFTLQAGVDRTASGLELTVGPEPLVSKAKLVSATDGQIELSDVRVPYGIERLQLTATNGFGASSRSEPRTVYSLGSPSKLPKQASYVLVDKRSMTLYDIRQHLVVRHYEIATGTPSTPTPNGLFKLGAPQRALGSWGVLRRPLYRFSSTKRWPSGFYIHGTNAPWDIGTWASHGCVRLYNWAIRRFSKTVPNGTLVLIRK